MKTLFYVLTILLISIGCNSNDDDGDLQLDIPEDVGPFRIDDNQILMNGETVRYKGVNTLQTFGIADLSLMNEWRVEIIREFIGNLREQPISGGAILASNGTWYHSLQNIVDNNRSNGKITILCPFGWVNETGERKLLTGLNPSSQSFYDDYKLKMRQIAAHFKGQPDVWIEVWNEPYSWQNANGYTHDLWLSDMRDMVDNLRSVSGFKSIIVVPGNGQGQSEDAIISRGNQLKEGRYNLLFDLHAYEKWLLNTTENELISRINTISNQKFAFIIGEVGVENVGGIMPVTHLLNAAEATNISTLAWLWNRNTEDKNALLTDDGEANASERNGFWGSQFREFLSR